MSGAATVQTRERGWLPGRAPIGYINGRSEAGEKIIAPDPERFGLLERLWELLLSGVVFPYRSLHALATDQLGLLNSEDEEENGWQSAECERLVSRFLQSLLRWTDPFSEPVVSRTTRCADHHCAVSAGTGASRQNRRRTPQNTRLRIHRPHTVRQMQRSNHCGGEGQSARKPLRVLPLYPQRKSAVACREKSIEERQLERQIAAFLESIYINRGEVDQVMTVIDEEQKKELGTPAAGPRMLLNAPWKPLYGIQTIWTKLRYRELIADEEFIRQRAELSQEQAKLQQRIQQLSSEQWIEPSQRLFLFSNRAIFWLTHGSIDEKRLIFATTGSNPTLTSKKLSIDARNPFRMLPKTDSVRNMQAIVNDVRTFFREIPEFVIPLPCLSQTKSFCWLHNASRVSHFF